MGSSPKKLQKMTIGFVDLTPYLPLSTNVERGTGGEVFKDSYECLRMSTLLSL